MTTAYVSGHPASEPHSLAASLEWAAVPARLLMSVIFLFSGFGKVVAFSTMVGYLSSKGMPAPKAMVALAAFAELAGGLSLLLGLWTRIGALGLIVFMIPTSLIFHNFWAVPDPMQHQDQMAHFLKNVAIIGGLLMVVAHGAGPLSIDCAMRSKRTLA